MLTGRPTLEEREKARQWLERDSRLSRKAFESRIARKGSDIRVEKENG